jgi:hypothetical protein
MVWVGWEEHTRIAYYVHKMVHIRVDQRLGDPTLGDYFTSVG